MKRLLFYAIWLAVVICSLVLAVTRFKAYGVWGPTAIIMGVGMLTLFAIDHVLRQKGNVLIKARIGDLTTLFIILAIETALVASSVLAAMARKWYATFVFGVFAFAFGRILVEYLSHLKRKYPSKAKTERQRSADHDEARR